MNRTGVATSPLHARQMLANSATPASGVSKAIDGEQIARVRIEMAQEVEPMGTMPPPGSLKELATTTVKALKGEKATVLLDKLGERLAFERTGTRLYEAILSKLEAFGSWRGGPSRAELEEIHAEELQHFMMLREMMEALGSDPTAVTPSANLAATVSRGLCDVILDPRTDLRQCLEAILVAELVDNDCFENLIPLARGFDRDELVRPLEVALAEESTHLRRVRAWVGAAISVDAFGHVEAAFKRTAIAKDRANAAVRDVVMRGGGSVSRKRPGASAKRRRR
jgi:hypothetical protein